MPQAIEWSFATPKISAFLPSSRPIAPSAGCADLARFLAAPVRERVRLCTHLPISRRPVEPTIGLVTAGSAPHSTGSRVRETRCDKSRQAVEFATDPAYRDPGQWSKSRQAVDYQRI